MLRINKPLAHSKGTSDSSFWQIIEAARKSLRAGRGVRFEDINWS